MPGPHTRKYDLIELEWGPGRGAFFSNVQTGLSISGTAQPPQRSRELMLLLQGQRAGGWQRQDRNSEHHWVTLAFISFWSHEILPSLLHLADYSFSNSCARCQVHGSEQNSVCSHLGLSRKTPYTWRPFSIWIMLLCEFLGTRSQELVIHLWSCRA